MNLKTKRLILIKLSLYLYHNTSHEYGLRAVQYESLERLVPATPDDQAEVR